MAELGGSGIPVKRKSASSNVDNTENKTAETKPDGPKTQQTTQMADQKSAHTSRQPRVKETHADQKEEGLLSDMPDISHSLVDQSAWLYYSLFGVVTISAFITRLYKIEVPPWVCWDETHFGKMGSWYINHTFFFDVHPPLGKMLIGFAGYLSGYDGQFPFEKPGDMYGDTEYVGMRMFCACLGASLVPLTYMSTWLLSKSVIASLFASSFVLFDVGTNTLSRHILLDPILMFFIMVATFCLLKFLSFSERPFSLGWWFWLMCTGIGLAGSIGVKFVGLFVVLLAGFSTVQDLWRLLGQETTSMLDLLKHFLARALCLIGLPILCYMLIFAVHFMVLSDSGNGDGFYSSQFQSSLQGNRLYNVSMPEHVAYGSVFSLKQRRTGGAYLHSHWHLYPESHPPRQQQITCYSHKDTNNLWLMKHPFEEPDVEAPPIIVKNGDLVRLEHAATKRNMHNPHDSLAFPTLFSYFRAPVKHQICTKRNMHSHREPAPMTPRHFQVSGYGEDGRGDANDIWQIEVPGLEEGAPLKAVKSKLRLVHYHMQCALQSRDKKLPKWGFDQLEVTCNPNVKDPKTYWSIEEVLDERLPNISFEVHAPSFLEKFMESHSVMTQGNSGLKPKDGEVTSRPWQWPINFRGQIFSGKEHRIYLLGNPVVFLIALVCKALFLGFYLLYAIKRERGVKMSKQIKEYNEQTFSAGWWLLIGWGLHYLPFWPMTRVLYFHHYFPAFLYSAMLAGITIDYGMRRLCFMVPGSVRGTVFHLCIGAVLSTTAYSFYLFHPLTFGMSGGLSQEETSIMHGLKWLDSWDF